MLSCKRNQGFAPIFLVVPVFLILLLAGSIYYWQMSRTKSAVQTPANRFPTQTNSIPTPADDSTQQICEDTLPKSSQLPQDIKNTPVLYSKYISANDEEIFYRKTFDGQNTLNLNVSSFILSPDKAGIAYMKKAGDRTIYYYNFNDQTTKNLTLENYKNNNMFSEFGFLARFSPNKKYLVTATPQAPPGTAELYNFTDGKYVTTVSGANYFLDDNSVFQGFFKSFPEAIRPAGGGEASGIEIKSFSPDKINILFSPTETVDYFALGADKDYLYFSKSTYAQPENNMLDYTTVKETYWKCDHTCSNPIQISKEEVPDNNWQKNETIIKNALPNTFPKDRYENGINFIDPSLADPGWALVSLNCSAINNKSILFLMHLNETSPSVRLIDEGTGAQWAK